MMRGIGKYVTSHSHNLIQEYVSVQVNIMTISDPVITDAERVCDEWTGDNGSGITLPIATVGDRMLNQWFDLLELLFQAFMEKYVVFVALLRQFR